MRKQTQRGYAVLPLVLLVAGAVTVATVMSTSVVKTLVMSVASAKARAQTEAAMAADVQQLTAGVTFSDANVAQLPAGKSAAFAPADGAQLPTGANLPGPLDGWGNPIGYCAMTGTGPGNGSGALISAGKDGVFQTLCSQAVVGAAMGDDVVRVINSATLLNGRTGSIHHGMPLPNTSALNSLQYIAVGEIRPVMDDGSGKAALFFNPTGQAGKWVPLQSQGTQVSPLFKGLAAYWPLDEVSGNTSFDAIASHDLAFSSAPVATPGVFNNGHQFTGYSQFSMPEIPASGSPQVTVAMWLDGTQLGRTGQNSMFWAFSAYDIIAIPGYLGFNTINNDLRGVVPPTSGKHLFVFVMDSRTNSGDTFAPDERIYVDGVRQSLIMWPGGNQQTIPADRPLTSNITIGGFSGDPSHATNYQLSNAFYDDFAVWKRPLSDDEVSQLWQSGRSLGELMTIQSGFVQRNGAWQPMAAAPYPMCLDYRNKGAMADGVYLINPSGASAPFPVRCDMTRDGGGWTVFQRRFNGSVDFYQPWATYVAGFGQLTGEFWLGLDKLSWIASTARTLRIDLGRYTGDVAYAKYNGFTIGSAATNYVMNFTSLNSSNVPTDSLAWHNGQQFSTYDANHQTNQATNCSQAYHGAWWYAYCHSSNLNGAWLNGPHSSYANGVEWSTWTGQYESLTYSEMKVR
ncbi:fibrinogen-related protein [Ralstonia pseudosolanacearum]|uniref:fibrinogen-related protein n=1 Tax=Ralstonia pseudosolanacearum TaxID=1310165 RepID=UPI003CFB38A3